VIAPPVSTVVQTAPTPKAPQPVLVGFPTYPPRRGAHHAAGTSVHATAEPQAVPEAAPSPDPEAPHATAPSDYPPGPVEPIAPASAEYPYRFVPAQTARVAAGAPQIFAIYLNSQTLVSHGPIQIRVATSGNVVKLVTHSNGQTGTVPKVRAGVFEAKSKLPAIPFIASGVTTTLDFEATSALGKTVTVGVPVSLK